MSYGDRDWVVLLASHVTFLHAIGDFFRTMLGKIPLPVVRAVFIGLPVVLLIWVVSLSREKVTPPQGGRWYHNLKVWAGVALLAQIAIYFLFGFVSR